MPLGPRTPLGHLSDAGPSEQSGEGHTEPVGQPHQRVDGHVDPALLEAGVIRHEHPEAFGRLLLLGEPLLTLLAAASAWTAGSAKASYTQQGPHSRA